MGVYWSVAAIPELAGLSEADRRRVWRSCFRKTCQRWEARLAIVLLAAAFTVALFFAHSLVAVVLCGLAAVAEWQVFVMLTRRLIREQVRDGTSEP